MDLKRISLLACTLAVALGGCEAAPDGQMPDGQMAASRMTPCVAGPNCQTRGSDSSFSEMSKGISSAFEKLTGGSVDPQTETADAPAK